MSAQSSGPKFDAHSGSPRALTWKIRQNILERGDLSIRIRSCLRYEPNLFFAFQSCLRYRISLDIQFNFTRCHISKCAYRAAAENIDVFWSQLFLIDTTYLWAMNRLGTFSPAFRLANDLPATKNYMQWMENKESDGFFTVPDLSQCPNFCSHPSVSQRPHFVFYAGVPVISHRTHCMGVFLVQDVSEHEPLTPEQIQGLKQTSQLLTETLQESHSVSNARVVPTMFFDSTDSNWSVIGANIEFSACSGISSDVLSSGYGLFDVFRTENKDEIGALKQAVTDANGEITIIQPFPQNMVLNAILRPKDPSGCELQLVMSMKPHSAGGGCIIWALEVHAWLSGSAGLHSLVNEAGLNRQYLGDALTPASITETPSTALFVYQDFGVAYEIALGLGIITPRRLSDLYIVGFIGRGSFGRVYEGKLGPLGVALKVQEGDLGDASWTSQEWFASFEAMVAINLDHPHVIQTYDWWHTKELGSRKVVIIQELCDRKSLRLAIKAGVFQDENGIPNLRCIVDTAHDIAVGMEYLHSRNVVHADLSSNNVLLRSAVNPYGFVAKLTDFGLSRVIYCNQYKSTQTYGTISHMPPELLNLGQMSRKGDVYSFGVILWELITSLCAWNSSPAAHVILEVAIKGNVLKVPSSAPQAYYKLATACMSADADLRPSFVEIVQSLKATREEVGCTIRP